MLFEIREYTLSPLVPSYSEKWPVGLEEILNLPPLFSFREYTTLGHLPIHRPLGSGKISNSPLFVEAESLGNIYTLLLRDQELRESLNLIKLCS